MKSFVLFAILLTVSLVENKHVSYMGYKTYEVQPNTETQRSILSKLEDLDGIDFWKPPTKTQSGTVMVAPQVHQNFLKVLDKYDIQHHVVIPDVEQSVRNERNHQIKMKNMYRRSLHVDHLSGFLSTEEIIQFLYDAADNNDHVIVQNLGNSFEGRPILMARLSTDFEAKKPVIMLEAGIHAREWAAPALALHVIYELIRNSSLLQHNDYHIIPMANPDGYEYTQTTNRFWRKTRSRSPLNNCIGVDGNRNFDTHWAEVGSSDDPCATDYHGSMPFSEVESQIVAGAAAQYRKQLKVYISLHSFGNYLLYPMGNSPKPLRDAPQMKWCGKAAARMIRRNGGPRFTVGNTAEVLYPSAGGSDDYVKEKFNVPFAYTMELPGGGGAGFDIPPNEISTMVHTIFPGILSLADCWRHVDKITFPDN